MKFARISRIACYVIVMVVAGSLIYCALFESGGGRSSGFNYGNLWLRFSVQERGILGEQVEWLVASPVMPKKQIYRGGEDQWTYIFENGKEVTFSPDPKNLVWVAPDSGTMKVSTDLNSDLIQRIEQTQEGAKGERFGTAYKFLSWNETTNAEPIDADGPAAALRSKAP